MMMNVLVLCFHQLYVVTFTNVSFYDMSYVIALLRYDVPGVSRKLAVATRLQLLLL